MTVAELIEKLREMPQDALVATASGHIEGEELATGACVCSGIVDSLGEVHMWMESDAAKGHVKVAIVSLY